tara:strand:- start:91 stop:567 length:477 start_codon:yes stop_codon:yes gene_type:complete
MPAPAVAAIATVARFLASKGSREAIKKYGKEAVEKARKHLEDLTNKKTPRQKQSEKATKNQRTYREGQRKAGAVLGAAGLAVGRASSNGNKPKEKPKPKPKAKAKAKPANGRVNPSDYPTYKKNTASAKSFREAQREAKRKGQKTFTWEGRRYNTTEK